jgi:selenium metabolism protein YedF
MKTVDTRGQLCPAPLIATKRALRETAEGEEILVMIDNRTSFNNVSRFLNENNTPFTAREEGGIWTLTVSRGKTVLSDTTAEEYCTDTIAHFSKGDFVVAVTSDKMGEGDAELGTLLMTNFIKALKDLDKLPRKIVFYNKGVTLVTKTSPLIEHLKDLEKMGVELLLCATCVNHYSLQEVYGAGSLSNMYTIAEVMSSASSVIRP